MAEKPIILVADDSKVIRAAVRQSLGSLYTLVEAEDGAQAWEIIKSRDDLSALITDTTMPLLSGRQLLAKVRKALNPHIRELPVIVLTGNDREQDQFNKVLDSGATDFILKPFDLILLKTRVRSHITSHQQRPKRPWAATINPDTRIGNRDYFLSHGGSMLAFAKRHQTPMALVLLHLSNHSQLKDICGGDMEQVEEAILSTGAGIAKTLRLEDSIARLNGVCFGLLLQNTDEQGAQRTIERVRSRLAERPIAIEGNVLFIPQLAAGISTTLEQSYRLSPMLESAKEMLLETQQSAFKKLG